MTDPQTLEQVLAVVADSSDVTKCGEGLWRVDWLTKKDVLDRQARLFSYLCSVNGYLILDVEESLDDSPVHLSSVDGIQGVGNIALLEGRIDSAALIDWLTTQQWLALACDVSSLRRVGVLRWNVAECFQILLRLGNLSQ